MLYQRVLDRVPNQPDALHFLGIAALDRQHPQRAIELIQRAIAKMPGRADTYSNLGNAYRAAGLSAQSVASYQQAIALDPHLAAAHSNLARILNELGDHGSACESACRALALSPDLVEARVNLATALHRLGRLLEAEAAYRQALDRSPADPEIQAGLALVLADRELFDEAIALQKAVVARRHNEGPALLALGATLRRHGDIAAATSILERAVTQSPSDAEAWNMLGGCLRAVGRFPQAIDCFRRALAIAPGMTDALRQLTLSGRQVADKTDEALLATVLARQDASPIDRVTAGFALGKACDDTGRYDEAFAHYTEANGQYRNILRVSGRGYDACAFEALIGGLISRFDAAFFAGTAGWAAHDELPVFVLGMPRSGTSLVEQVLASHSQVVGAGERSDIGKLEAALFGGPMEAAVASRWNADRVAGLAASHIRQLQGLAQGAARVIDKMPDNVLKLALIAVLLPGARVIFCERDLRDTCLSCFFQFFPDKNHFSYDLRDCGHRYLQVDRLVEHWRTVLPLRTATVRYERLVDEPELEIRRMLTFLGLDWESACLDFHNTERSVLTASSWQVRQPLFGSSVARWRHYAAYLSALPAQWSGNASEIFTPDG